MRVNSPGSFCIGGAGVAAGGISGSPLPNVRVNSLTGLLRDCGVEPCCTAGLCGIGPAGEGVSKNRVNSPGPDFAVPCAGGTGTDADTGAFGTAAGPGAA